MSEKIYLHVLNLDFSHSNLRIKSSERFAVVQGYAATNEGAVYPLVPRFFADFTGTQLPEQFESRHVLPGIDGVAYACDLGQPGDYVFVFRAYVNQVVIATYSAMRADVNVSIFYDD